MGRDWLRGNVKRKVKVKSLSCVWLFATPWTGVYQNPPSMGFSRQEYWSGLPFPSSGDLPTPGIEPWSPTLQADALPSEPPGKSTEGKLGLILMGRAMLSKSLIQFSVPSLLFDLKPNYGGGNEDNGNLLQKVLCTYCPTQCPWRCSRPPPTHTPAGDSWTLMGKSGSISCGVTAPFTM